MQSERAAPGRRRARLPSGAVWDRRRLCTEIARLPAPPAEAPAPATRSRTPLPDDASLAIVIVTHRCWELVDACLRSIAGHPYTAGSVAVTVVDNASGDGTVERVRAAHPTVRVIALAENRGFSAANNVALRTTTSPHVLLLNPDTEVWPGVLDAMVAFQRAHERAGVVGCRLVRRHGQFDHAAKRSFPTPADALRHFGGARRGAARGGYHAPQVDELGSGPVDAVNGAFMLVRRAAIEQVGLLDEGYFMYGEDLDWCMRFKRAGWDVLYNGAVTTLHVKGGVAGGHRRLRQNWAFHRAMGRFYRRHLAGDAVLLDLAVYAAIGAKFLASALRSAAVRAAPASR